MGHFQNIIIRPQTGEVTTSAVGTVYQDLPEKGMLSALMVDYAAHCLYSTHPGLPVHKIFTKIEVLVNGSKVIKSFDAQQGRALAHTWGFDLSALGNYNRGRTSGDVCFHTLPILFGRYPGDKEYMLDLEQYSNPQLRITYDASQTTVDGVTYAASATPFVRTGCAGLIWKDGNPGTKGYIKSTNIDTWATVASTVRTVEIPRGQHLLGVMQGARHLDDKLIDYIERMEITFDNGDWQPINHSYQQLKSLNAMWFSREVQQSMYLDLATTDEVDTGVGEIAGFNFMSASGVVDADQSALGHDPTWNYTEVITTAGMNAWLIHIHGIFPHQNIYIPFTEYSEDADFGVDTTKWGRIDVKTTSGAAAAAGELLKTVAEFAVPNGE
jgi:hypothetical protein